MVVLYLLIWSHDAVDYGLCCVNYESVDYYEISWVKGVVFWRSIRDTYILFSIILLVILFG